MIRSLVNSKCQPEEQRDQTAQVKRRLVEPLALILEEASN